MAKFCTKCGRPLQDGEICECMKSAPQQKEGINIQLNIDSGTLSDVWENMKVKTGMSLPKDNMSSAFEEGLNIIPDCVKPNEGEIPIRQYTIAELKNKIMGFTFAKAVGRIQVTNKRVIFRAPGWCLTGRTTLQQEFVIDEIGGVEARREYMFNAGDVFIGLLVSIFGSGLITFLLGSILSNSIGFGVVMSVLFGVAGCVPFFTLKKKWLLKLLCIGLSIGAFTISLIFGTRLFLIFILFTLALWFICIFFYAIKPNLVFTLKSKGASGSVINIRRGGGRKKIIKSSKSEELDDHTGFSEIIADVDAEKSIRELGAIINDIQKMGDYALEKWKM